MLLFLLMFLVGITASRDRDCNCLPCKYIPNGQYSGDWTLLKTNSSSCPLDSNTGNGCLYVNNGTEAKKCFCDPGDTRYDDVCSSAVTQGSNLLITSNITGNEIENFFDNITQMYGNLDITLFAEKKLLLLMDLYNNSRNVEYKSNDYTEKLTTKVLEIYNSSDNHNDLTTKLDDMLKEIVHPGNPEMNKIAVNVVEAAKTISKLIKLESQGGSNKLELLWKALVNNTEKINEPCQSCQNETKKYGLFKNITLHIASTCLEENDVDNLGCGNGVSKSVRLGFHAMCCPFLIWCPCFAGTGEVETMSGIKNISELVLGDFVRTSSDGINTHFTEFIGWLSRESSSTVKMVQFSTTRGVPSLTLTGDHIIFTQNSTKPAGELVPGDRLIYWNGSEIIEEVVREIWATDVIGYWTPLTRDGTLMVDGFLSSCYSSPYHQLFDLIPVKAMSKVMLDDEESQHKDGLRPTMELFQKAFKWMGAQKRNMKSNELSSPSIDAATQPNNLITKLEL